MIKYLSTYIPDRHSPPQIHPLPFLALANISITIAQLLTD